MEKFYIFLFGSRGRGNPREDSDWDLVISECQLPDQDPNFNAYTKDDVAQVVEILRPFAIENGGKIDLFMDNGFNFLAVYDENQYRGIYWSILKHASDYIQDFLSDAKPVSMEWVKNLARSFSEQRGGSHGNKSYQHYRGDVGLESLS